MIPANHQSLTSTPGMIRKYLYLQYYYHFDMLTILLHITMGLNAIFLREIKILKSHKAKNKHGVYCSHSRYMSPYCPHFKALYATLHISQVHATTCISHYSHYQTASIRYHMIRTVLSSHLWASRIIKLNSLVITHASFKVSGAPPCAIAPTQAGSGS